MRFDRENATLRSWANQVKSARQSQGPIQTQFINAQQRLAQLEKQYRTNPSDGKVAFELASVYLQLQQTNAAFEILDQLINGPQVNADTLLSVATAYAQLQQGARLEAVLERLVKVAPDSPEAWYNLAATEALVGKEAEAMTALGKAVELSTQRLAKQPAAQDLRKNAATNQSFAALRSRPEFRKLVAPP